MTTPRRRKEATWTPAEIAALRRALLDFYDTDARSLPWRDAADPYRIWVSEIMLQQTRVDTVIPYYERWLERFPHLDALADAPLDDVLHAWQGLGYYSRARNLHRSARLVRERHGGVIPDDTAALRALPGVGEYTAGAVASIAYGRAEPAVDGNVRRVLARLRDEPSPTAAWLRRAAGALVPAERAGDFNQALMELGATLCLPRDPRCGTCPVADVCRARAAGTQSRVPVPDTRAPVPEFRIGTAAVFDDRDRLLLVRQPAGALLGGMWLLPGAELHDGESAEAAARRSVAARLGEGADLEAMAYVGRFRHAFSHRREVYDVTAFRVAVESTASHGSGDEARHAPGERAFIAESTLHELALARSTSRIAGACFAHAFGENRISSGSPARNSTSAVNGSQARRPTDARY